MAVGGISVVVFAFISTPAMKRKEDRRMLILGNILQVSNFFLISFLISF